jgi:hypothetical protein
VLATERVDRLVSVLLKRLSISHMLFTEWRRRAQEDERTMDQEELAQGSYRDSTRRTRKQTKRLSSKLLVVNTEKSSLGKSRSTEVVPPHRLLLVSKNRRRHITLDEEEPIDVRPKQYCTTDELVSETEEREVKVETLSSIWVTLRYLVEEERRDLLPVRCHRRPCRMAGRRRS